MTEPVRSAELLALRVLSDDQILDDLKKDPQRVLPRLATEAIESVPRVLPIPPPTTTSALWVIIVGAFALVMVGAVAALGAGTFTKLETGSSYVAKSEVLLTVFSTVVAFLAGLLSPSPINK